ncbi:MAG: hypothetical protein ACYS26_19155, partial [Planctomycetota bacterium]
MAAKPRPKPPAAGMGRRKGSKNKTTVLLKEAIEESFANVGGAEYLTAMAVQEPKAYLTLLAKILPAKIEADINVFQGNQLVERLQQGRTLASQLLEE